MCSIALLVRECAPQLVSADACRLLLACEDGQLAAPLSPKEGSLPDVEGLQAVARGALEQQALTEGTSGAVLPWDGVAGQEPHF